MTPPAPPRFGLFNTEARIIHSRSVGQDFQVGVWFPFSYAGSDRTYPVLYVPDGEFAYGVATGLIPTLIGNGEVPELLVVGIAYHGITSWQEHGALRDRDLLPDRFTDPAAPSRSAQFVEFFRRELFPLIEMSYRGSAEDRALFGFSSAGFFSLRTMLTQPGMFRRHIAASCTWPGAGEELLGYERQHAQQPHHPPTDLFLAVGGLEEDQLPGFRALTEALQQRNDPGLRITTQILDGEGHSSGVIAKTFLEGVRAVYRP
jgi:predicted alpha/beta superfamily hydrolase